MRLCSFPFALTRLILLLGRSGRASSCTTAGQRWAPPLLCFAASYKRKRALMRTLGFLEVLLPNPLPEHCGLKGPTLLLAIDMYRRCKHQRSERGAMWSIAHYEEGPILD